MFRFGSPYYFALFLPLAVAAWWVYRRRIRSGIVFAPTARLPAGPTWRSRLARVLPALALAGGALMIVALARPQTVFSKSRRTADVIAIQMAVDVSGSMEALDLSDIAGNRILKERTRLDAVKEAFAGFIEKRPDDMVGLVTFGGFASTRSPLTTDHAALLHVLKGVEVPRPSLDGKGQLMNQEETMTAIGDGLATACARLEKAEAKTKIIVLLSDGVSNAGVVQPEEAARVARKMKIKVYSIGVGSSGQAPFRGSDMLGQPVIQMAQVAMDEGMLRRIAEETGGRYFNVRDKKGLEATLADIDKLEKTRVQQDVYNQYTEQFPRWLAAGLALVVLGTGLNMTVARRIL